MTFGTDHHLELVDDINLQLPNTTFLNSPYLAVVPYRGSACFLPTPESAAFLDSPMASHVELDQASTEMHTCPECGKQFPRNCDLNKHAKSHTRPFKCSVSNCKYFELGWPTAKELDRHVNDKHSLSPQTFPCQFRDCAYRSKRESNCKQHMEKTHGWTYVKSKTNGKRSANQQDPLLKVEPDESAMLMDSRQNPYPTPRAEPLPVFNTEPFDFVLFEDDEPSVLGDADEVFDGLSPDGNQYLPWNSPMTRLRMTENFLERFSETYNSSTKSEPCKDDDLIDPQLSDAMHIDVPLLPCANNGVRMYPPVMGLKPELALMTAKPVSGLAALPASSAYSGQLVSAKRKRDSGILEATSGTSDAIPIRHRRAISAASAQSKQLIRSQTKQFPKKEEESDEEDTKPARKKRRSGEHFSDNNMPDIFHFAHPTIYNRDKKEKYSPCHSDHKDISTLVRHLSRPAHRLRVTDKLVSSFEIEDDDYMHPRVGVCRRCWSTFDNQQRFEDHLNVDPPCEKVSKGKREKWNILHDAFTPLVGEDEDAGHGRRGGLALLEDEEDEEDEPPHAISRPTSPTTVDLTIAPPDRDERRYVPMAEHRRVQQENMQLKNFLQELAQRVKQNQGQAGQGAAAEQMANLLMQPRMSLLPGRSYQIETAQPEPERYHHHDIPYDAACLVGHMDSQSTDVDRQGLMEDVKTLSRANSGLDSSESRSTLHHVPTEDVESVRDGVPAQPQEPPPASNPDSGYATHSKRPSYAQEELAAQIKVSGVMTGHGAGVTTTSQAGAMMSQQIRQVQRELDLYQANYAFLPQPNGLSYLAPPGHGEIKAPSPTNERSISDAMWGDMRDPFAGAGSSQAASQSVANMISYSGGPGGEGGPEYPYDLVDFENDLSLEH